LQEVLKAVATSLKKFKGDTAKEFWGWCYRIARNKLSDQFRSQYADRLQPVPPEELWKMMWKRGQLLNIDRPAARA
jgi:DNA-directed RNA polymerase specialized sigma24 family protein